MSGYIKTLPEIQEHQQRQQEAMQSQNQQVIAQLTAIITQQSQQIARLLGTVSGGPVLVHCVTASDPLLDPVRPLSVEFLWSFTDGPCDFVGVLPRGWFESRHQEKHEIRRSGSLVLILMSLILFNEILRYAYVERGVHSV